MTEEQARTIERNLKLAILFATLSVIGLAALLVLSLAHDFIGS